MCLFFFLFLAPWYVFPSAPPHIYQPGPAHSFFLMIIISKDLKVDATLPFLSVFNDFSQ